LDALIAHRLHDTTCLGNRRRQKNTNVFSDRRFPKIGLEMPETSPMLPSATKEQTCITSLNLRV
jgi:hypothetical protein